MSAAYVCATTGCNTQLINDAGWDVTDPDRSEADYLAEGQKRSNTQMCMVLKPNAEGKYEIRGVAFFVTGRKNPNQKNEQASDAYLDVEVGDP